MYQIRWINMRFTYIEVVKSVVFRPHVLLEKSARLAGMQILIFSLLSPILLKIQAKYNCLSVVHPGILFVGGGFNKFS